MDFMILIFFLTTRTEMEQLNHQLSTILGTSQCTFLFQMILVEFH